MTFVTIGHSDHSINEFLTLLSNAEIALVVDVRRLAGSRAHPQFNAGPLTAALGASNIGYEHLETLTGRRPRSQTVSPETNALWRNQSFHNYADYGLSVEFASGITRLFELEQAGTVAIMCAEAVWWRCHRRIIADHLLARGAQVEHIISGPDTRPASLTPGAQVAGEIVTYPPT